VYSDRTRGELQVAKNNFFCSEYCHKLKEKVDSQICKIIIGRETNGMQRDWIKM
jgi:hypothetical protein